MTEEKKTDLHDEIIYWRMHLKQCRLENAGETCD